MPDDVPDYEQAFLARYRITLAQGVVFLRRMAAMMTCDADEANDLVHDVLVEKILPALRRDAGEPIGNPKGYLYTTLRNYWIDRRRDERRWATPTDRDPDDVSDGSGVESQNWFWDIVGGPCFPADEAEVIRLRLDRETFGELGTWQEIGDALGITRDTASRRFHKGMATIRRMVDGDGKQGDV